MPFGPYSDFAACVADQRKKGKSDESARKICGALQKRLEKRAAGHEVKLTEDFLRGLDDEERRSVIESELADAVEEAYEEGVISEAYIVGEDDLKSENEVIQSFINQSMKMLDPQRETSQKQLVSRTLDESNQSDAELGTSGAYQPSLGKWNPVEPPYPPEILVSFLQADGIHARCVQAKVDDSVNRHYTLEAKRPVVAEGEEPTDDGVIGRISERQAEVEEEIDLIEDFIENCNEIIGFEGVLERAAMDYESVGYAAIEVIRSVDMRVRKLDHIPAQRVKVLEGWNGFIEETNDSTAGGPAVTSQPGRKVVYYQPFGQKVVAVEENPFTEKPDKVPYNPKEHGENFNNAKWNLVDKDTGKPTQDFMRSANEIVWITKHHPSTIYYGLPDIIPALGWLLANVHIRDNLLQFFEHNTVPRYAIIIEGARLEPKVEELIRAYFETQVKSKAHKVLILPVPSIKGEVKVRFEQLDTKQKEGDFRETKNSNDQSIMVSHGVSPAIIGISETASLGSGKGLSQAEIYKDRIVGPRQRKWGRKINKVFSLGLAISRVLLKFIPLDIRDVEIEMETIVGYVSGGLMSINEARKRAGLGGPVPGGNRLFVITNNGVLFVDKFNEMGLVGQPDEAPEDVVKEQFDKFQSDVEQKTREQQKGQRTTEQRNGSQNGQTSQKQTSQK